MDQFLTWSCEKVKFLLLVEPIHKSPVKKEFWLDIKQQMICRSKKAYEIKFKERGLQVKKSGVFSAGDDKMQETAYWIIRRK